MQHHFDISIAQKYGVNVAIFLDNLSFWIKHNIANRSDYHFRENTFWTYNSQPAFLEIFPYWSIQALKTVIKTCKDNNIIKVRTDFNDHKSDRKGWYCLTEKGLSLFNGLKEAHDKAVLEKNSNKINIGYNQPIHKLKSTDASVEINLSSITDINTDKKPDRLIPDFLNKDLWEKFKDHRKKIKKPMTDHAITLLINKIIKFRDKGHNVQELLEYSIECGYPTIYEPRKSFIKNDQPEVIRPKYRDFTQERLDRESKH